MNDNTRLRKEVDQWMKKSHENLRLSLTKEDKMEQANLTYAERLILIDIIDEKLEDNGLEEKR